MEKNQLDGRVLNKMADQSCKVKIKRITSKSANKSKILIIMMMMMIMMIMTSNKNNKKMNKSLTPKTKSKYNSVLRVIIILTP